MKNRTLKTISVLLYFVFYIISASMTNLYCAEPTFSNVSVSIVFLISFWFMTFMFSHSKKFLIFVSIYFLLVITSFLILIFFEHINSIWLTGIALSSYLPLNNLIVSFGNEITACGFVIISFYAVFFIGKYIKSRKDKI